MYVYGQTTWLAVALRAARNGPGGSLGYAMLKTLVLRFTSESRLKSCGRVDSVIYVKVIFFFCFKISIC